jgi:hypothetical protein
MKIYRDLAKQCKITVFQFQTIRLNRVGVVSNNSDRLFPTTQRDRSSRVLGRAIAIVASQIKFAFGEFMMHQQQPNETLMQELLKLAKTAEQHMQESSEKLIILAERL